MKKPCSSAGHRWARQTDPGLRGDGFSLPLLLFHRLVVLFFFFPRLVCATQKQPLRKEGKKRKEKKKEEKLVFLAGCELFPPHYFPKNRSEHESFNNKYVAVFVCFGTKKTFFWSSPKVFFHV